MPEKVPYSFYSSTEQAPVCSRAESRWALALLSQIRNPHKTFLEERIVSVFDPRSDVVTQMKGVQKPVQSLHQEASSIFITEGPATGGLCVDVSIDSDTLQNCWRMNEARIQGAEAVLLRSVYHTPSFSSERLERLMRVSRNLFELELNRQSRLQEIGWFCSCMMYALPTLGIQFDQEQFLVNTLNKARQNLISKKY